MIDIKTFLLICKVASWVYTILAVFSAMGLVAGMFGQMMETTEDRKVRPMRKMMVLLNFGGGTLFLGGTATILYLVPHIA